jgi:Domain of unknown function (DUF4129)
MSRGGSRATIAVTALGVLVLVGAVAVASSGSTPTGDSSGRRPSEALLDAFFSLAMLSLVPAAALFIWGLTQRKAIAAEIASGRYPRTSLLAFLVFVTLFSAVFYAAYERDLVFPFGGLDDAQVGPDGQAAVPDPSQNDPQAYQAEFSWIAAVVVISLVALAILAYVVAARRRRTQQRSEAAAASELAAEIDDTVDDLRAEPDPRRAVIAAYARLERAFAAAGLPRNAFETAEEYLGRILAQLDVGTEPTRQLTDLFVEAKFSRHEIDEAMKERAIKALADVRDELRAAARRSADADEARAVAEQAAPS